MSTQELKENDIQNSSIPFVNHFNKLRHQPKWILKSIIMIVLAIISAFITYNTSNDLLDNQSIANSQMDENMFRMTTTIGAFIGTIFSVVVVFLIFLVISKIFKIRCQSEQFILSCTLLFNHYFRIYNYYFFNSNSFWTKDNRL